ncbi:TPM domain-containing protein [Ramlibacter aurantiacus]|nr:TPM domain-containing protein [Ramlibacter aurantiacus]
MLLLAGGLLLARVAAAQDLQPVPELSARVVDLAGTLAAGERQSLEAQLAALEQQTGAQVVVLLVPSTQPEDIFSYANRVANAWKIGRREIGDGVLVVVATSDRRIRIEVAKTLEGAIPDLRARRIIDEAITPQFRRGDFAAGLRAGVEQIGAAIRGEALPPPQARNVPAAQTGFDWMELAVVLFIAMPVAGALLRRMLGRPLGSMVAGGAIGGLAWALTASFVVAVLAGLVALFMALVGGLGGGGGGGLGGPPRGYRRGGHWGAPHAGGWGAGRGGGGGGFGGFGSGGGGDFGGGGASGSW